ncbi:MAG: Asp-tRNA(Asn)/Glu-tRNA(Gln) amidotransferase subunit GatA [Elusimicrobiota bacterium]
MNSVDLTAVRIAEQVRRGELRAEDAVKASLDRIKAKDQDIKAFISVLEDRALEKARDLDKKRSSGRTLGRLAGVPVALKDNIVERGARVSAGSRILADYEAVYDAHVVERLEEEGAVIVGKTNLDEFAMGSSTENSAFFPTKNPWDIKRVPGGSSGGSAAAVACGMVPLAFGSDTGGSIRQPAAFCGVVGLKPSYGTVSRYGLIAFASSFDQIGPLARTVQDAALALCAVAGHDARDSTSAPAAAQDYLAQLKGDLKGKKIGLPKEFFAEGLDPEVEKSVRDASECFKELGAEFVEVSLPSTTYSLSAYYILANCEASANLARFDGVRYGLRAADAGSLLELYESSRGEGFGPEVKRRIMLGTYALSSGYYDAYYLKAQKARTLIVRDFDEAFVKVDLLLGPTAPTAAFKFGEKAEPLQMYLSDCFTIPGNISGCAGVSIPCGRTKAGLPIGLQLMGRPSEEGLLLRAASRFEEMKPFPVCPD